MSPRSSSTEERKLTLAPGHPLRGHTGPDLSFQDSVGILPDEEQEQWDERRQAEQEERDAVAEHEDKVAREEAKQAEQAAKEEAKQAEATPPPSSSKSSS